MTDPFKVLSSERGVVRVFTSDLDAEGSSAVTPENVQRLLGDGVELDIRHVEVFPSTVLDAMGLSAYLQEGYGISPSDLVGTSEALDRLKGLVILVASPAFQGRAVALDPNSGIRFVGAFQEPAMAPPERMKAPLAAEGPVQGREQSHPAKKRRGSMWPIAVLLILAAAALVLFVVF
ncbi:MAG: hypothetical protein AAFR73_06520 [Pseudomonadota bacterium]